MAGTSRPDDGTPTPPGGGAAERLREFRAARGEIADDDSTRADQAVPPDGDQPPEDERTDDDEPDGP